MATRKTCDYCGQEIPEIQAASCELATITFVGPGDYPGPPRTQLDACARCTRTIYSLFGPPDPARPETRPALRSAFETLLSAQAGR